jgi:hypothetical protein
VQQGDITMKSVEACIEDYLEQIEKRKNVDYADKASVRRFNAAYDKCFQLAEYIDDHYPEQLDRFVALLEHSDIYVVSHCAPMLIRLNNTTIEQKRKALETCKSFLNHPMIDEVTKLGFSLSIPKWEEELRTQSVD